MDQTIANRIAVETQRQNAGDWYPACGGTETVFRTRMGRRLLYCWQPTTGKHAYLDVDRDVILTTEEAQLALGVF
jgi:hypothetical protein